MALKKPWFSLVGLVIIILILFTALPAQALTLDLYIGQRDMWIDTTESVTLDAAPYIKNDRTMVPVSAIALAFGANVSAYQTESGLQARIEYRNCDLFLTVGDRGAHFVNEFGNDVAETMDVAPEIQNGRMMVPLGVIAMGFGANISWDPFLQLVTIEQND